MYCYVVKWPVFRFQRVSAKSLLAPSNFSSLWIRFANGKSGENEHPVDCTTPDKFDDSQLGSCKGIRFNPHLKITGKVSYSTQANTDGWHGEWIKLISNDGITFKCAILGWIDGNSSDPKTQDFICKVKVWYMLLTKFLTFVFHLTL